MNPDHHDPVSPFHHHLISSSGTDKKTIVLAGNPNVGKSLIFNYLSGLYVDVSNYPGTTVELMEGRFREHRIIDTPGIYSVASFNDEERVAREIILEADIIVNVVDAIHLERDLFLTLQLIDMGYPIVIALNFMDELNKEKITIDREQLESLLGVPVIPTSATTKSGLETLAEHIAKARTGRPFEPLQKQIIDHLSKVGSSAEALLILEGDIPTSRIHGMEPEDFRETIYIDRRRRVNSIIEKVYKISSRQSFREWLGRITLHPYTGIPVILIVLYALYQLVGVGIAQYLVGFTEDKIGKEVYEPFVQSFIAKFSSTMISVEQIEHSGADQERIVQDNFFYFSQGTVYDREQYQLFLQSALTRNSRISYTFLDPWAIFLAGEFGLVTMTVTYLFFLLLPLVIGFYFFLAVLEDCGYLPRLATFTDGLLSKIGLNGRAIIPILLGFGCVTMATVTTRLLSTQREKTIAAAILNFVIPCSAQLAVITALLARAGGTYVLWYVLIMFVSLVLLGSLLNLFLPGKSSSLLIDLPPLRFPRLDNLMKKTFLKSYHFMKEAIPFFMIGSALVTFMQLTSLLRAWEMIFRPVTTEWLLLPPESAIVFIMGLIRRDFGAAGFLTMELTSAQILTGLVTLTFFVPCIASMMILFKERGSRQAIIIWFGTWMTAFVTGGIIARLAGH